MQSYEEFIASKQQLDGDHGFDPLDMPSWLFDYQQHLVEWSLRKGRAAIFADCGMGKTPMQLVWADNVYRKTGKPVLILTPLAVSYQTVGEAQRFGIDADRSVGGKPNSPIVVTNYEKLQHFDSAHYGGVVCDESSILKCYTGKTRESITAFMNPIPFRLLCTARAAPNDYVELGTSSEALGHLERKHMLARFFTHDGGDTASWRLKGHVRSTLFWQWVCTWARACGKPSDLGFDDGPMKLPPLNVVEHVVESKPPPGVLFETPAVGLADQRADLKRTLHDRCEMVASHANQVDGPFVAWTSLNAEADLIASMIPGAVNIQGSDSDDRKESAFRDFVTGNARAIVTKPTIAGFGLNWQHCANTSLFPSHSYEQYYQLIRRFWRFGQSSPVTANVITTIGQSGVADNLKRKQEQAELMFENMVTAMRQTIDRSSSNKRNRKVSIPSWL